MTIPSLTTTINQKQADEKRKQHLLVPTILLSKKEVENLNSKNIPKTYNGSLKCNLYHIPEDQITKYLITKTSSADRAMALRMVSKALAIRNRTSEVKASLLAVAAGLMAAGCPMEADRLVRAI